MPRNDAILAAVAARSAEITDFLERVVNIDSPTLDKALSDRAGDLLQARAEALGLVAEVDRQEKYADNRICRFRPGNLRNGTPRVLMIGHFDTVYSGDTSRERPFTNDGTRITGPGCHDMKGGLTIGLYALQALADLPGGIPLEVTFIFNGDEEVGSPESRSAILAEAARHDVALILEPGRPGPALTVGRKGVGVFRIAVDGREAHSGAEPENGINSIVEAAHKVLAIQALNDWERGTVITPGTIEGGTAPHVVPGRTVIGVDCRVTDAAEQARIEAAMARIAAGCSVPGTTARLTGGFHRPPMEQVGNVARHIARIRAIAADQGYPLATAEAGGASDGNLTAAAGLPTIDGLGTHGGRAHSPDEWVESESLVRKTAILAAYLASLAEDPIPGVRG